MNSVNTKAAVAHTVVDSPVGPLTLVACNGAITALYMTDQAHRPDTDDDFGPRDDAAFAEAIEQLEAYFAGDLTAFDLPLEPQGTDFMQRVWAELREIPYGETVTYGEIAERIGKPSASRAVGLAVGRNPIGIVVPCHRVVGANGKLTGYAGGLPRKQVLLDLEQGQAAL